MTNLSPKATQYIQELQDLEDKAISDAADKIALVASYISGGRLAHGLFQLHVGATLGCIVMLAGLGSILMDPEDEMLGDEYEKAAISLFAVERAKNLSNHDAMFDAQRIHGLLYGRSNRVLDRLMEQGEAIIEKLNNPTPKTNFSP